MKLIMVLSSILIFPFAQAETVVAAQQVRLPMRATLSISGRTYSTVEEAGKAQIADYLNDPDNSCEKHIASQLILVREGSSEPVSKLFKDIAALGLKARLQLVIQRDDLTVDAWIVVAGSRPKENAFRVGTFGTLIPCDEASLDFNSNLIDRIRKSTTDSAKIEATIPKMEKYSPGSNDEGAAGARDL